MNFGLDDLDSLVITEVRRPQVIYEYSLSALTEMKSVNCREIALLIKNVVSVLDNIKDEKTRDRITRWVKKDLNASFIKNMEFSPVDFYRKNEGIVFSQRCVSINGFEGIVSFMNSIFQNFKNWERKGNPDAKPLYDIFLMVKETCKNLGIKSASTETLCNAYMNPESGLADNLGINIEITDDELDIDILSIPYFITFPHFRVDGEIIEILNIPINEAKCYYNRKKYNELTGTVGLD